MASHRPARRLTVLWLARHNAQKTPTLQLYRHRATA